MELVLNIIEITADTKLNDGDIVFFMPDDFIGNFITEVTESSFSHVAKFVDDQFIDVFIEYQAGSGKRMLPKQFYFGRKALITNGKPSADVMNELLDGIGKNSYDYKEAIIAGLCDRLKKIGIKLTTPSSGEICSTFIAKTEGVSTKIVSPGALYLKMAFRK
jgi:hypothetical protein